MHCGYIITPPSLSHPSCLPLPLCLFGRLFARSAQEPRRYLANPSDETHILCRLSKLKLLVSNKLCEYRHNTIALRKRRGVLKSKQAREGPKEGFSKSDDPIAPGKFNNGCLSFFQGAPHTTCSVVFLFAMLSLQMENAC